MVTCHLKCLIDPYKAAEFERYSKMWTPLVQRFGGQHHGYFLPSEGANNIAIASRSSLWQPMKNTVRTRSKTQIARPPSNTLKRAVVY